MWVSDRRPGPSFPGVLLCGLLALPATAQEPPGTESPLHLPSPLGIGTEVEPYVYAAWNISIPPSGVGLPEDVFGTVEEGLEIFFEHCAGCHNAEVDNPKSFDPQNFPHLTGGRGTLADPHPLKTVGSYWPYATTLYDYIHRAMPFPEPQSLRPQEIYSLAAFILSQNQIPVIEPFGKLELLAVEMPNRDGFTEPDPRPDVQNTACMIDCQPIITDKDGPGRSALFPPPVHPSLEADSYQDPGTGRVLGHVRPQPGDLGRETLRQPVDLPFDLRLVPVDVDLPVGLHSYSASVAEGGRHPGSWLLIGGRTEGLHRTSGQSFPQDGSNQRLWAVNPKTWQVASVPVRGLSHRLRDALTSTDHQDVELGGVLWISGGYGWSARDQDFGTFGLLIAVDVDNLVDAIFEHDGGHIPDLGAFFSHGKPRRGVEFFGQKATAAETDGNLDLLVTGGGLVSMADDLVLALGHRFGGEYNLSADYRQFYTCQVLRIPPPAPRWGGTFEVEGIEVLARGGRNCSPGDSGNAQDPYHRRDLNVTPRIQPDRPGERAGLAIYGGVFTGDFSGFDQPILVDSRGGRVIYRASQLLSQYEAAKATFFSAEQRAMHTLVLGGMGIHYCTAGEEGVATPQCIATEKIVPPAFTEDGTVLSWNEQGRFSQALLYEPFLQEEPDLETGLLGTNAAFLRRPEVAVYDNGVIKLDQLPGNEYTTIGHVFGGIATDGEAPRNVFFGGGPSWASKLVFEVRVRPR